MNKLVEIQSNLFDQDADAICLTTNGVVKENGRAVMGAGNALQARKIWPDIDKKLGRLLEDGGNNCHIIIYRRVKNPYYVVSFPVKYHWRDLADLDLIRRSAHQLMDLVEEQGWQRVILPRPGCSCGGRDWATEVKPILVHILDKRVIIISPTVDFYETVK